MIPVWTVLTSAALALVAYHEYFYVIHPNMAIVALYGIIAGLNLLGSIRKM